MKKNLIIVFLLISVFIFSNSIYAYEEYKIGDKVKYENIDFYVIKNSSSDNDSITLIKKDPISSAEIKDYLQYTEVVDKVNISDIYATMTYYSKDDCVSAGDQSGCTNDYSLSSVKQVVDVWGKNYLKTEDLKEDSTGYSVRLITFEELLPGLGYDWSITSAGIGDNPDKNDNVPSWVFNSAYFTMSSYLDSNDGIWVVSNGGALFHHTVTFEASIRPVITLKRSAIYGDNEKNDNIINSKSVNVPNTYLRKSLLIIIIGFIFACVSIVIYYIIKKKYSERK